MQATFYFKIPLLGKILYILFFMALPVLTLGPEWYAEFGYYLIVLLPPFIVFLYQSSKKIYVTDEGIREYFLWSLLWKAIAWEDIESMESFLRSSGSFNLFHGDYPLKHMTATLADQSYGRTYKLIVKGQDAYYLASKQIRNFTELLSILENKLSKEKGTDLY
jgi:hypothetical protein